MQMLVRAPVLTLNGQLIGIHLLIVCRTRVTPVHDLFSELAGISYLKTVNKGLFRNYVYTIT